MDVNTSREPATEQKVHKFQEYSYSRRPEMNRLQKSFYTRTFRPNFLAGEPIDVGGESGYGIVMLHDLLDLWETSPDEAVAGWKLLRDAYPGSSVASHAGDCLRGAYLLQGLWPEALDLSGLGHRLSMILGLSDELGHPRVRAADVFMWNQGRVTKAALGELGELITYLGTELDAFHDAHGVSMIEGIWKRLSADAPVGDVVASIRDDVGPNLDDEDIAWYVERARGFGLYYEPKAFLAFEEHTRQIQLPRPWPRPEVFGHLWQEMIWAVVRRAENQARTNAGLPRVGEGLVSEVQLLNSLRESFPDETVNHQVRPTWLAPQSLDMVFAGRRIAVEYQGVQHSRAVEYFGGQDAFEDQQARDATKRRLCMEFGMRLIEVHPGYVLSDVIREIQSLIDALPSDTQ